jgi:hypothetical protein
MRGVRLLLCLTAAWAGAALFVALPAHATELQQCGVVAGRLVMSPGLTNVPTAQTITAHGRLTNCSSGGGSATFAATISTTAVTCTNLATGLLPADVAFGWHDGESSIAALSFTSPAGSPSKEMVTGTVISGAALGTRVAGGLRLSASLPPAPAGSVLGHAQKSHAKVVRVVPLDQASHCSPSRPVTTVVVSNFQGFVLQARQVHVAATRASHPIGQATTGAAAHPAAHPAAHAAAPTTTSVATTATTTTTVVPAAKPRHLVRPRAPARKVKPRRVAVAGAGLGLPPPGNPSAFNAESLLGAGVAVGTLIGCGLLFYRRSKNARPRRRRVIG